jgi:protein TonB
MIPQELDLFHEYFQEPFSIYVLLRPVSFDTTAGTIYWLGREDPALAVPIDIALSAGSSYALGYRPPPRRAREWMRRAGQVMAVTGALLVPVTWLAWDAAVESREKAITAEQNNAQRLQLSMLRAGGDLLISWTRPNPSGAPLVAGRLTIVDSDFRKEFVLDRQQLASGRMVYRPLTSDVNVVLHATTSDNQQISDSLRAFYPAEEQRPETLASLLRADVRREPPPTRESVFEIETRRPQRDTPRPIAEEEPEVVETPVFQPRRLQLPPRPRAATAAVSVPEAPDLAIDVTGSIRNAVAAVPTPRDVIPAWRQQSPPAAPAALFAEPKLTPAVATSTPHPQFSQRARDALKSPLVIPVKTTVDAKGRVTSAVLVEKVPASLGPLAVAAEMAARRWRFRPATVAGRPVPSEVTISFRFVP